MRINDSRHFGSPSDVVACVRLGAALGVLFGGSEALTPYRVSSRWLGSDIHPWLVGGVILFGCCFAGLLAGAVRPLVRRLPAAIGVGIVAAFPVLVALDLIRRNTTLSPSHVRWGVDTLSALALGTLGAVVARWANRRDAPIQ